MPNVFGDSNYTNYYNTQMKGRSPWVKGGASPDSYDQALAAGYEWDPVQHKFTRTPSSTAQRAKDLLGGISLSGLDSGGGLFGQGGSGTGTGSGSGTPANIAHIAAPDMTASNAATFGAAKDRAGQMARASLDALNGELGSQGMLGSGAQVQGTKDIIMDAGQFTSDVNRQNAVNEAQMKGDFAKLGYQGDLTQRGQDIQHEEANAQLALAQQDRQMKMLQVMLQALGGAQSMAG